MAWQKESIIMFDGREILVFPDYDKNSGLHCQGHYPGDTFQAFYGVFDGHGGAKAAEYAAKNLGSNIINEVALRGEEGLEEAVREGYLTTNEEFLKLNANGGSCCVTELVQNGQLIISNAGDCRAVMSRRGVAEALTVDHQPSRQDEMERIQHLGGYIDSWDTFRPHWNHNVYSKRFTSCYFSGNFQGNFYSDKVIRT